MHDSKDTNPKDALGVKKAPLHCIPCGPLYELGLIMMEGGRKYGTHNYRAIGARASVYYDAAMRHLTAWWEGADIDPDSGLHPLMKVAACAFVMRDSQLMGNDADDRPIKYVNGLKISKFNELAEKLIEKIPDCASPFLEKDKKKFVCPPGWKVRLVKPLDSNDCGWIVDNTELDQRLWKNLTLNEYTGWDEHKFGEAPGYWPTKEDAEAALAAYLKKTQTYCEHCEGKIRRAKNGTAVGLCKECSRIKPVAGSY